MDFYRFSLSWSRILPTGYANVVSKDGIGYYHALLNELEKNNIEPLVTLYHWDHPQVFQELGGWTNEVMVDLFGDYARVVFKEFGHRIKKFATLNEPLEICRQGFYFGSFAPGNRMRLINENLLSIYKQNCTAILVPNFMKRQAVKRSIIRNSKIPHDMYLILIFHCRIEDWATRRVSLYSQHYKSSCPGVSHL